MSTPFPPNSKRKGLSIYAPPRVRDRAFSQDSAENADTSAQTETAQSEADQTDLDQMPADDASPANEAGAGKDPLAWLDDAIREVVELNQASDSRVESDPSVSASSSPSITPMHDDGDDWPASSTQQRDRAEFRKTRPHPPRHEAQIVPPPPPPKRESGRLRPILQLSLAIVFAAIVAYGVTLFYPSRPAAPRLKASGERIAEATPQQTESQRTETQQTQIKAAPQIPSRLVVEDQQAFANEPVSLAVNVEHATGSESVLLDGLAQGTKLSAGTSMSPSSWQLSPDKLAGLYLYAPKDFVGVMNATVNLLDPDKRLLDSRDMQLKWLSKPPPPPPPPQPTLASAGYEAPAGIRINPALPAAPAIKPIDPGEAAMLMQRSRDFLAAGDISAARVAFRRLADAGMPDAALALANTYDSAYLAAHNVVGVLGDRAMARTLYQRAKDLGSAEAGRILARMVAH
jgi:hypothetical protein